MRTLVAALAVLAVAATAVGVGVASAGRQSVAEPAARAGVTVTVRTSAYGRVLFDGRRRALYAFTRDSKRGRSRCYGACAATWPVYYAKGRLRAGKGAQQHLIGTTRRRDGRLQVTYGGRPLYFYVGDRHAGEIRCQNVKEFGGTWLVVRPSGQLVR
jgi:predicted lipoprotein with Yx(FWY)xxD motif